MHENDHPSCRHGLSTTPHRQAQREATAVAWAQQERAKLGLFRLSTLWVVIAGGLSVALGLAVLVGWYTHNVTLIQVAPTFAPMQFNSAVCFLLGGASLLMLVCGWLQLAAVGGMVVAVVGLVTLSEYLFNVSLGIDQFLWHASILIKTSQPGRMAPNAALSFALLGILLCIMSRTSRLQHSLLMTGPLGAVALALGLVACIGYITGLATYSWGYATHLAVHTAAGLVVLAGGVIAYAWQVDRAEDAAVPLRLPVLVGVAVLTTTLCLWQALIAHQRALIEQALSPAAANVQNEFSAHIDSHLLALTSMAKRWERWGQPAKDVWLADAELHVQHFPGLQAVAWVDPSRHVRWFVPVKGNEGMQDLYLAFEEKRRDALDLAQGSRQVTATRLLKLVPAGPGIHVYIPIFRGERFEGYIVGVFRVQELLDAIFANVGGNYALAVFIGDEEVYRQYGANIQDRKRWAQEVAIGLYGVTWRIQLWPTPTRMATERSALPEVVLFVGLLTAMLLGAAVHFAQIARWRALQAAAANQDLLDEIAERQRVVEALQESEMRFRSVTQSANEAIIAADSQGTMIAWNKGAQTTFGYAEAEVLGQPLTLLMPERYREAHQQSMARLRTIGALPPSGRTFEFYGLHKDGSEFPLEISLAHWEVGKNVFYSGIIRDLTERKHAEEELQRQREALFQREKLASMSTLLAGVTHELNNPLAIVMMEADLLSEEVEDHTLTARTEKISQAAQRCVHIIQNFLAMVHERPPERLPVQFNAVVEAAVELLEYPLRVDNIAVHLQLDDTLPVFAADPHQLHQVVLNLISNAHYALCETPPPRHLTLTTRYDPGRMRATLEVADTGPGMLPEIQARLFEPFFTTKPPGVGTGLGLSLCQGIIESHGGSITVESQPGSGTTFRIELPVKAMPVVTTSDGPLSEGVTAIEGQTILVVDDEPGIASALAYLLRRNRHHVDIAANGRIALQKLQEHTYDLILSDMRMPELDGPGLYQELEHHYPHLLSRIIFLTGDTLSQETKAFLERTSVFRVSKPFTAAEIRRIVQQALQTS